MLFWLWFFTCARFGRDEERNEARLIYQTRDAGGGIFAGFIFAEHRIAKSNYDRDRQRKKLGVLLGASGRKTADGYGR